MLLILLKALPYIRCISGLIAIQSIAKMAKHIYRLPMNDLRHAFQDWLLQSIAKMAKTTYLTPLSPVVAEDVLDHIPLRIGSDICARGRHVVVLPPVLVADGTLKKLQVPPGVVAPVLDRLNSCSFLSWSRTVGLLEVNVHCCSFCSFHCNPCHCKGQNEKATNKSLPKLMQLDVCWLEQIATSATLWPKSTMKSVSLLNLQSTFQRRPGRRPKKLPMETFPLTIAFWRTRSSMWMQRTCGGWWQFGVLAMASSRASLNGMDRPVPNHWRTIVGIPVCVEVCVNMVICSSESPMKTMRGMMRKSVS